MIRDMFMYVVELVYGFSIIGIVISILGFIFSLTGLATLTWLIVFVVCVCTAVVFHELYKMKDKDDESYL